MNNVIGRKFSTQTIQFTGNRKVRTASSKEVNLMQAHGFRFNTSEKVGDYWVMEYTRIVTSFETVSKALMEKLGKQYALVSNKDALFARRDSQSQSQMSMR